MSIETISLEEFQSRLKAQGVPLADVKFICPMCETKQSANDLIAAGAGSSLDEVEKYLAFSCVGRFTGQGSPLKNGASKGRGCDWTLGGLLGMAKLQVETPDGQLHPRFEVAS